MLKAKLYLITAIIGIFALGVSACVQPTPTQPTTPTPAPSAPAEKEEANFRFLISDEVNAIDDFQNLFVTVSRIGVQRGGESGNWTEFMPDISQVDLKPLVDENALEIYSGNLTPGEYSKVFIYVSQVEGILTDNATANVKLPSEKLQISKPFVVSEDSITSFVFDITVIKAGKSGMYVLKPQIAESGADKDFSEVKPRGEKDRDREREKEHAELRLQIEGEAQPGADVTLVVLDQGEPVEGATITVDEQEIGSTDGEGKITLSIPQAAEEVEIKATLGEKEGELELELEEEAEETELEGTIEDIDGHIWAVLSNGKSKAVDVENAEIDGNPEVGAKVEIEGISRDGLIVASKVEIEEG